MITDIGKDGLIHISLHRSEGVAPCGVVLLEYVETKNPLTCVECIGYRAAYDCGHTSAQLRHCDYDDLLCNCCDRCDAQCVRELRRSRRI